MKNFPILVLILSTFLMNCGKEADSPYFIEAEIDGVKWKGKASEDPNDGYLATGDHNSKMKLWFHYDGDPVQNFTFYSTDSMSFPHYYYQDTTLINYFIGPFDGKYKVKLRSTFENNIDRFEIEQKTGQETVFKLMGTIPATGTSTTVKEYSLALGDRDITELDNIYTRIKIVTKSGRYHYTPLTIFNVFLGKAQIAWYTKEKKLYFALDNNQNQMSVTAVGPGRYEKTGTFSFNYVNEAGDTVRVKNGKFHVNQKE